MYTVSVWMSQDGANVLVWLEWRANPVHFQLVFLTPFYIYSGGQTCACFDGGL